MPFVRTITEGDLDSRAEEFVRDVSNDARLHDADFEVDGMDESAGSMVFGRFDD